MVSGEVLKGKGREGGANNEAEGSVVEVKPCGLDV